MVQASHLGESHVYSLTNYSRKELISTYMPKFQERTKLQDRVQDSHPDNHAHTLSRITQEKKN